MWCLSERYDKSPTQLQSNTGERRGGCPDGVVKWFETKTMRLGDEDVPNVKIYERFESTALHPWFDGDATKDDADAYLSQVFRGVQALHTAGYMHTGIQLDNVYMSRGPKFALGNFENSRPLNMEVSESHGYFSRSRFKNLPWWLQEKDGKIRPVLISTKLDGDYVSMVALDNFAFLLSLVEVCRQVQEGVMSCIEAINGDPEVKGRGNPATVSIRNVLREFFGTLRSCRYHDDWFEYAYDGGYGGERTAEWSYGGVVCSSEADLMSLLDFLSNDESVQKVIHGVLHSS